MPSARADPVEDANPVDYVAPTHSSEEDILKQRIQELEDELEAAKAQRKYVTKYRKEHLSIIQKQVAGVSKRLAQQLKQQERRTATFERFSQKAQKKSVKIIKQEKEMRAKTKKLEEVIKKVSAIPNRKANFQIVDTERKKKLKAREEMLEVQKNLQRKKEEIDGERKEWRSCQICREEYSNEEGSVPRVLDCGHTMCESCINRLYKSHFVECPFDRKDTCVYQDGVADLPKNLAILNM